MYVRNTKKPQQKNWHNRTTVLYTKYVRNTKNYFPPEPKKLTQHHNCMILQVHSSMYNQNLFPARTKTDTTAQLEKRFLQPTQSECYRFSVCQWVSPSFCEG